MKRRSFITRIVAAVAGMFVARPTPVTSLESVGKCFIGDEKEPIFLIFKWEITEGSFQSIAANDLAWIDRKEA